jgi:hypothetical protein
VKFFDLVWEVIDNGLYLAHLLAIVFIGVAAVACPIWLGMIHAELVALRGEVPPCQCECHHADGPGPVLPRVLPRLRRIGEEAAE